ncbi:uncharacterized protein LOC101239228 [Hydra vulgaris]|uniref:Uncharacterized protein LOC101239228 n=1 Tax=Hydra vulgaris TaxID=6087 RepID=A0ABM4C243_HYDVU
MKKIYRNILLTVTLALTLFGFICVLCGLFGNSWWQQDEKNTMGLWKTCSSENGCLTRESTLRFTDADSRELDSMIIALIVSIASILLTVASLMYMMAYRKNPETWNCGTILLSLFTFISAAACLSTLIFAETRFKETFQLYKHGWSVILAWLGAIFLILSFACAIVLLCTKTKEVTRPIDYTRRPSSQNVLDNLGYVHDD